eukprot:1186551-Prorocentrum_minimum.AAC.2
MAEAPAATELQPEADPPESEKKEDVLGGTADGTPSVTSDGPGREPSQIFSQAGQGQIATTILPNLAREHSNRAHQLKWVAKEQTSRSMWPWEYSASSRLKSLAASSILYGLPFHYNACWPIGERVNTNHLFASQEWFDRARAASDRSKAMHQEAGRIRNNTSLVRQKIAANDLATFNKVSIQTTGAPEAATLAYIICDSKTICSDAVAASQVNMGFRSHMSQTSEMVRRLNDAIRNNQIESTNLNEGKRQMLKIKEEIETPLVICQKRLDMQHSRPQRECVEDNLHMVRPHYQLKTVATSVYNAGLP